MRRESQSKQRATSLGLTGAGAIVSAATPLLVWGFVGLSLVSSIGADPEDGFGAALGAVAVIASIGLLGLASRTLLAYGVVGPFWAILLPAVTSVTWAAATLGILLTDAPSLLVRLPAPLYFIAITGLTLPAGVALALAYTILRLHHTTTLRAARNEQSRV